MDRMKIPVFCILLAASTLCSFAQQGSVASGGQASGSGGTISYSVGQVDYIVVSDNATTIAQGLQQPYEISIITGLEEKRIELSSSVYPNPTANQVTLIVDNHEMTNMIYRLFDAQGKLIKQNRIIENQTVIQMNDFPPAVYFLKINTENTELKTFKIIKNQ
jgi:hypothetical protein